MSTAPQLSAADAIRESHEAAAARIRAQPELSDRGRAMLLAKSYLKAKDKMTALEQSSRADDSDQRTQRRPIRVRSDRPARRPGHRRRQLPRRAGPSSRAHLERRRRCPAGPSRTLG